MITHNTYFNNTVQSLGFVQADGTKATAGVLLPGEYTFNTNDEEHMQVVSGACTMNEKIMHPGETYVAPAKTALKIVATESVAYLCTYHS